MRIFAVLTMVLISLAYFSFADAATLTVTNTSDSGANSLRQAIIDANGNGDLSNTINFSLPGLPPHQILLLSNLPDITKSLTITGPGETSLAIDGNTLYRAFYIDNTVTSMSISGLTIQRCSATYGAGLYNAGTITSITNVTFSGNATTNSGGAMYNAGTITSITNVTFSGNAANSGGGGLYNAGPITSMSNVTFSSNTVPGLSGAGGGIYNDYPLTMTDCTISSNTASDSGGGIYNDGPLTMTNCTISSNTASDDDGGGIYNADMLTMNSSTVSENKAGNDGGGIYNNHTLTMTNVTVSGNESDLNTVNESGGGIYNNYILTMTNCTIANNIAHSSHGHGIYNSDTVNLFNTLIANNSDENCSGTGTLNADYSLSSDATCNFVGSNNKTNTGDPNIGPLANNGGPTQTHVLLVGSPAIDTGNNSFVGGLSIDQRGYVRIWDGNGDGTAIVDIGAYEYDAPLYGIPTMNEWGMIIFMVLSGLGAVYYLRRQKTVKS
jgi:predicted outer membrane repeat protein